MRSYDQNSVDTDNSACLENGEPPQGLMTRPIQERDLCLLPPRERNLLRLAYYRGATRGELAGALGVSRSTLDRMLRRAHRRATDPANLALVRCWRRLSDQQQRLVRLNRFWGMSLRQIARDGLIAVATHDGHPGPPATLGELRSMMRATQRKARRNERRRLESG
jgi:DNA-directed RNA polymerase specialized sigma24 family protein